MLPVFSFYCNRALKRIYLSVNSTGLHSPPAECNIFQGVVVKTRLCKDEGTTVSDLSSLSQQTSPFVCLTLLQPDISQEQS